MVSCTFCNSPQELRPTGSSYSESPPPVTSAVIKGLELICKTLEIPLQRNPPEVNSLCLNCTNCLRDVYEFYLEIEVLQLKIGDKIKDIHIAVLEGQDPVTKTKTSDLAKLFVEKCKKFRKNPFVLCPDMIPEYLRRTRDFNKTATELGDEHVLEPNEPTKDDENDGISNPLSVSNPNVTDDISYDVNIKLDIDDFHNEQSDEEINVPLPADQTLNHSYDPSAGYGNFNNTEFQEEISGDIINVINDVGGSTNLEAIGSGLISSSSSSGNTNRREIHKPQPPKGHDVNKIYPYPCIQCNRTFTNRRGLVTHISFSHKRRLETPSYQISSLPLNCGRCGKVFTARQCLRKHIKTVHEKTAQFTCRHCGDKFLYRATYFTHLARDHADEKNVELENSHIIKNYACPHCNKKFSNQGCLASHIKFIHLPR